jgi:FkbM family methyltransferase
MTITTTRWQDSGAKRLIAKLSYPIFLVLNRPAFGWLARAAYDFALRCNGIAINFPGHNGLGIAEERFLRRISARIQGRVLIDVGAHHGHYCNHLAKISPRSPIYAFEPHPRSVQILRSRLTSPQIRIVNKALGETSGRVQLHDFVDNDGSSQASLSREAVAFFATDVVTHDVECATLDEFLASEQLSDIAYLKIDAEGFDIAVLRGARMALARRQFEVIQFEFIPANIVTRTTMRDFFEVLEGYDLFRICLNGQLMPLSPYSVKRCEIYVHQNLVAVRTAAPQLAHSDLMESETRSNS